jgi:hypothetical protein
MRRERDDAGAAGMGSVLRERGRLAAAVRGAQNAHRRTVVLTEQVEQARSRDFEQ